MIGVIEEFCPQVEVLHPGTWAIAARGPARYFGGEESLAAQICAAIARRGIDCRAGVAGGLFAALLAAGVTQSGADWPPSAGRTGGAGGAEGTGCAEGTGGAGETSGPRGAVTIVPPGGGAAFLAPFEVAVLEIPELTVLLPRLGLGTLGEFAALPAAEAAARFGAQGALAHRMARGLAPRPLAPQPPRDDLAVGCEFDPPEPQSEPVAFAAKALAGQMHASLAARGLACVRIKVQVTSADGRELTRLWRHDGLLSAFAVAERVRWQLDGWPPAPREGAPADDAPENGLVGGITLLRLVPDQLVRDHGRQLGLWGDAVVSDQVARAAIRVQAMLGHGAVTRPVLTGGRSPGQQVQLVPFGDAGAPGRPAGRPWPGQIPAPRRPPVLPRRVPPGSPTIAAPWSRSTAGLSSPGSRPGCPSPAGRHGRSSAGPARGR